MKIKKPSSKLPKFIWIIALLLMVGLICGGIVAYLKAQNSGDDDHQSQAPARSSSDKEQSDAIDKNPDTKETTPGTDTQPATQTNPSTGKSTVTMVASADISAQTLSIRGGLNSIVSDGTCYALLTGPSGQLVRKDTSLLQNASTTDCKTISVPVSELSSGRWTYTLNYQSTTTEGHTDESAFTIS